MFAIGDGQVRQLGRPPLQGRRVQLRQFLPQVAHRPVVANDVVHRGQQQVLIVFQPEQRDAQSHVTCQIERTLLLGISQPFPFVVARLDWEGTQVSDDEFDGNGRTDDLRRFSLAQDDRRAKAFVAADDFAKGVPQCRHVQRAADLPDTDFVVRGLFGPQPLQQPQPLLRDRQRPDSGLRRCGRVVPARGCHRQTVCRHVRVLFVG